MPHSVYLLICQWTFGLFQLFAIVRRAAVSIGVQISVRVSAFNSCGYVPGVKLLYYVVNIYLGFLRTTMLFSIAAVPLLIYFILIFISSFEK